MFSKFPIQHCNANTNTSSRRPRPPAPAIIIRGGVARGAPTDWNKRYYMLTGDRVEWPLGQGTIGRLLDG